MELFAFNNRSCAGEVEIPKGPEKKQKRQDRAASQRELTIRRRGQQVKLAKVVHGPWRNFPVGTWQVAVSRLPVAGLQ